MADYLNIAGRVRTTASDGVAMEAQDVKDLNLNKSQQEVNADVQTELGDRYTKEETYSKEQLNELITTPDVNYVSVVATDTTTSVTDLLPVTGADDTIYRVGNWDGTQYDPTMYTLYAWNGSAYVCLAVRSFVGEVYDISVNHPDGQGNPTPYADLAAALGTDGANIPADIRRGGMRIQFIKGTVQSSDNKYVQCRLMHTLDNASTVAADFANTTNWQGVEEEPTAGSDNLVKSSGILKGLIKSSGSFTIDYGHFISIASGGVANYVQRNDYDCVWVPIPANVSKLTIAGITFTGSYQYFNSMVPSSESRIGSNTTGAIPDGAILALHNVAKSANANYDTAKVIFNYYEDFLQKGFTVKYNYYVSVSADNAVSIQKSDILDVIQIFVPTNTFNKLTLDNAVGSGELSNSFYYFNSCVPSTESYIASNTTGDIPSGTILILRNLPKDSNDYDTICCKFSNFQDNTWPIFKSIDSVGNSLFLTNDCVVDNNHVVSGSGTIDNYAYGYNDSFDCIWVAIKEGATKLTVTGAVVTYYHYYSSFNPTDKAPIARNNTGLIPTGSKLCLINARKSDNPSGYNSLSISQDSGYLFDRNVISKIAEDASKGFVLLRGKALSVSSSNISFVTRSDRDCILVYLKTNTVTVQLENASMPSNRYHFFKGNIPSLETSLGYTDGTVINGSVLCVINIDVDASISQFGVDYYKSINVSYSVDSIAASEFRNFEFSYRKKTVTLAEPDEILEYHRCHNSEIQESAGCDIYTYNNIDPSVKYCFSGSYPSNVGIYAISYWNENGFIQYDVYRGIYSQETYFDNAILNIPSSATIIKLNVWRSRRNKFSVSTITLGEYYDMEAILNTVNSIATLKVVVNEDKSFYVRHAIDDTNDGILTFDYYEAYNFDKNCIMQKKYFVGTKDATDAEILAKEEYQACPDSQSPMYTENFGPMFSNHGYATPRVVISNHGLTDSDVGTEWVDDRDRHFTIGNIIGNYIYLIPVVDASGGTGYEIPSWKYSQAMPTAITKVGTSTTLTINSASRYDYQVSKLVNTRIVINGKEVSEGTYICSEVELAYEQIGYNPLDVTAWWPNPVYGSIMLKFNRHFTINGSKGFLSLTSNTVVNNLYPYPLRHYIDVVPQLPFQMGDYKPYIYIPKMAKHDGDIDFRSEFVSVDNSHSAVHYYRNTDDIKDVNDMPDRAYCYLKTDGGDILYGCAGGHSLVRGMSVKSIRNQYIEEGNSSNPLSEIGIWNPPAGNKHYNNIITKTSAMYDDPTSVDAVANHVPDTFINEFEGYMCWYKPQNGVQVFYHRSKEGYVVYIHTNHSINKGCAVLPDFMNNLGVDRIIEQTQGMTLKTSTVIDGKLFFSADITETEYNYIVVLLK